MSSNTSTDLALEYFKIGNAVVAFYVVQTLLFLNAIYKESSLLTSPSQSVLVFPGSASLSDFH